METYDFDYADLKRWLSSHIETIGCPDDPCRQAFALKHTHSLKVAAETLEIGRRLQLDRHTLFVAGIIGLLHDVGRFEQYRTYRTFNDYASVDHGELGARTIAANGALKRLHPREKALVVQAVRWHNKIALPDDADPKALFFAGLVRDADKLDIYRVVVESLAKPARASALPTGADLSDALFQDLMAGRRVCYKDIQNSTEMRLMQLNWVVDINFKPTLDLIAERGYIDRIAASLPDTDNVNACVARIRSCLKTRLG
jgi:hypothetical protein